MRPYDKIIIEDKDKKQELPKESFAGVADSTLAAQSEIEKITREALKPKRKFKKSDIEKEEPKADSVKTKEKKEPEQQGEKVLYRRIESVPAENPPAESNKTVFRKELLEQEKPAKKKSTNTAANDKEKTKKVKPQKEKTAEKAPEKEKPAKEKRSKAKDDAKAETTQANAPFKAESKEPAKSKNTDENAADAAKTVAEIKKEEKKKARAKKAEEKKELEAAFDEIKKQAAKELEEQTAGASDEAKAAIEKIKDEQTPPATKKVFRAKKGVSIEPVTAELPTDLLEREVFSPQKEVKEAKIEPIAGLLADSEEEQPTELQKGKKRPAKIFIGILIVLLILAATAFCAFGFYQNSLLPEIDKVSAVISSIEGTSEIAVNEMTVSQELNEDDAIVIRISVKKNMFKPNEYWFLDSPSAELPSADSEGWIAATDGACELSLGIGTHYIFVMDANGNISSISESNPEFNRVAAIRINSIETSYLAVMGRKTFTADMVVLGNASPQIKWSTQDEAVALVDANGMVMGHANGETKLVASSEDGISASVNIIVTDLITVNDSNTRSKPMLTAYQYTEEEAQMLDQILFSRVEEAGGYGTRAGVVAAARFITLEFPYRVPYFFENGRLNPAWEGRPYADGEGRYYHLGLYLSESKFDDLKPDAIRWGPAMWGQLLMNWETKYAFVEGQRYPNGFDCSGFVSWVLLNGGFDFGDKGAGDFEGIVDMCDYGTQVPITSELLESDRIKAGDLIYTEGHMAVIIGLTEEKVYVAESLVTSVRIYTFNRDIWSVPWGLYTHISLMDEWYNNEQGNYTDMWEIPEGQDEIEQYWGQAW